MECINKCNPLMSCWLYDSALSYIRSNLPPHYGLFGKCRSSMHINPCFPLLVHLCSKKCGLFLPSVHIRGLCLCTVMSMYSCVYVLYLCTVSLVYILFLTKDKFEVSEYSSSRNRVVTKLSLLCSFKKWSILFPSANFQLAYCPKDGSLQLNCRVNHCCDYSLMRFLKKLQNHDNSKHLCVASLFLDISFLCISWIKNLD